MRSAEVTRSKQLSVVLAQLDEWVQAGVRALPGPEAAGPIRELHLELTHRCDLKCVMCHHWEMPFREPASVGRELTPADIDRMAAGSELLRDIRFVAVTGGEPWVRPDTVDVVAVLRRRFPEASLGVLTNLWNTELQRRRLNELRERGVAGIWLGSSLDGLGDMHDAVRGQPGAFAGFERTLAMLRDEFPGTDVSVNFTILPRNAASLWDVYAYAKENSLGFGAQFVVNHEGFQAPETFSWRDEDLSVVEAQIDRILEDLCASNRGLERLVTRPPAESRGLWNQLLFWSYLRRHGRGSPRFFEDCMAGRRYAMLDPEGNLFFCPVNKHKRVGNVREHGFDAAWNSLNAEKVRSGLIPCECRCWLNCIANPILDRVTALALGPGAK